MGNLLNVMIYPLVSVNMPVYNGAKYIKQAIDSILNQTFSNFELIIVDDGSTDNSTKIIESYLDFRIKLYSNEINRGLAYTRNKAIELSCGKYIAVLDCDDIAYPERLEKQVSFLEANPEYGLVGSWFDIVDKNSISNGDVVKLTLASHLIKSQLFFGNYFAQSTIMMRKEIFYEFRYHSEFAPAEDYFLWSQIAFKYKVANLQESLVKYRSHDESISFRNIDVQEARVKKIFAFHLSQLSLSNFSEKQLELHYLLLRNKLDHNAKCWHVHYEILAWIKLLKTQNNTLKIYDLNFFNDNLTKYWNQFFQTSYQYGIKAIPLVFDPINNSVKLKAKLRFIYKCIRKEAKRWLG